MLRTGAEGHSRVPVYSGRRESIVGMLLVKRLIVLDPARYPEYPEYPEHPAYEIPP